MRMLGRFWSLLLELSKSNNIESPECISCASTAFQLRLKENFVSGKFGQASISTRPSAHLMIRVNGLKLLQMIRHIFRY
jgi:hypothetical protein